jgi:hypothetical protein
MKHKLAQRLVAIAALFLGAAASVYAQRIQVTANRTEAAIDDQIVLTIRVEEAKDAEPQLPKLVGFGVTSAGSQTQMSFINGRRSSSVSYNFVLTPKEVGTFEVGAASIEVDGKTYSSAPFQIKIVAASEKPREERDLFVTARVSTLTPFVGQQVIHTWRFYRRVQVADPRLEPPDFDGFLVEELGEVREYQAAVEGQQYLVSELRRALFPQEAGELTLGPGRLTLQAVVSRQGRSRGVFDDFFSQRSTERRVLRERAITLDVRPLPPAPPAFSGLVGNFTIAARATRDVLRVGESSTLKLTVSGTGNPQMIGEPALPPLTRFKIYDDRPTSSINRSGNTLRGSKSFSKALVPLEPGEQVLPALELTYFDPASESFEISRTEPIVLQVQPAEGTEDLGLTESLAPSSGKVSVRIMADDILPVYKGLDAAEGRDFGSKRWLLAAGMLAPPVLFLGLAVGQRRQRRFALDANLRRRRDALRRALARLKEGATGGETPADAASRCLREFIGDKLGLEGSALTPTEVDERLRGKGVEEALVAEAVELLQRLEAAQYGAAGVSSSDARETIEPLVRRLDKEVGS